MKVEKQTSEIFILENIIEDLKYSDYQLVDIDSNDVVFPKLINGKIGIIGYILVINFWVFTMLPIWLLHC